MHLVIIINAMLALRDYVGDDGDDNHGDDGGDNDDGDDMIISILSSSS